MKRLYVFTFSISIAAMLSAQASLSVQVSGGPARMADEEVDRNGFTHGFGLSFDYSLGESGATLSLAAKREDFTGFHVLRDFSQFVPALDPNDEGTFVSLRHQIKNWRAYSLGLRAEALMFKTIPRLVFGVELGIIRQVGARRIEYDAVEINQEGEVIRSPFREAFVVSDGTITRILRQNYAESVQDQLQRYKLVHRIIFKYQLSADVTALISNDTIFGPLGKDYGEGGGQNMLGEISYFRIGLEGKIF